MKKLITLFFAVFTFLIAGQHVFAADFETQCGDSVCVPDTYPDVFDPTFKWYPTASQTRTIKITNTSTRDQFVGHRADDLTTLGAANLANALELVVKKMSDNTTVWTGTIQYLATGGEIGLSPLSTGQSETYQYKITMRNVGNEYQNTGAQFDLVFGYIVPTMTPTPTYMPVSSSNGGGGRVQGTSTSSNLTACADQAPGSTPILQSVISRTNTATLTWTAAAAPVSYYLIAYGTSPENYLYGAHVGVTTTYTVQGLSGGTTYYFVVRAGNGCTPGLFSNELSTSPAGIITTGIAEGFSPEVLGEVHQSLGESTERVTLIQDSGAGQVEGEQDEICQNAWWWWMILMTYGVSGIVLYSLGKKLQRLMRILVHGALTLIAIVLLMYTLCN